MMALTSAGTGMRFMSGNLHSIGFFPEHIYTVVSAMAVATTFGGTTALTIMSTVFNNTSGISRNSPFQYDYSAINNLSDEVKAQVIDGAKVGFSIQLRRVCRFFIG
ncbi:hypothetical protein GGR53DRAFT_488503 [Hypoxylon sp. FL1150]|nr:hypothetical protein GGR53DRAFT_488503 [Hypoxylon sp. FL1150]